MNTTVFAERGRVKLVSDSRDVGIRSIDRAKVYAWISSVGIRASITHSGLGTDVWRIINESERSLFLLRWS